MQRILITGPESTGKTVLAKSLAEHYHGRWISEYARGYIQELKRPYTKRDVLHIARKQTKQYHSMLYTDGPVFFDTWLIITKVWMEVVYKSCPDWLDKEINSSEFSLTLLCYPDLPWEPDQLRENGGEMRNQLYFRYQDVLEKNLMEYKIVRGSGNERLRNAIGYIDTLIM